MLERIIAAVKAAQVSDWRIIEKSTVSHQAFFIKRALDQHRISDTVHTTLTVYMDKEVDGKKMRGSASHEFLASDSDEAIASEIEKMKFNASLALNPYFELVKDEKNFEEKKEYDLTNIMATVLSAIQNVEDTRTEKINSFEVFVNEYYYHMLNSQGVDISFNTMDEEIEIIINSIDGDHEIELYHRVKFADRPLEEITQGILDVFKYAKDRTIAAPTKKSMNMKVLMSGLDNAEFFEYFLSKTNTSMVYSQGSQVKVGDAAQSSDDCDRITVKLAKSIPGSSMNRPYSMDGKKAADRTILDKGVYTSYWGDQATSYYLGCVDSPYAENFIVSGGSLTSDELRQGEYLEIIQFSSFIMNPMIGTFGGEIRLAYYSDGEKVIPVTGGSITCNMNDVLNSIRISLDTRQIDSCIVPRTIEIPRVAVAGVE